MVFENYTNLTTFLSLLYILYFLLGRIILPPSFSNLSNLVYLGLKKFTFQGFKKNSLSIFLNQFLYIAK